MPLYGSFVKRSDAGIRMFHVRVGAVFQQQSRNLRLTFPGRLIEWSGPGRVARVHVRTSRNQQSCDVSVASICGQMQGGRAELRTSVEQQLHYVAMVRYG